MVIEVASPAVGLCLTAVSATFFQTYLFHIRSFVSPPLKVVQQKKVQYFFNIVTSLTHSVVSSIGCLYCFYIHPDLSSNIAGEFTDFAYLLSCFSLGYFISDLIDSLKNNSLFSNGGIVLHHLVVIFCFGLSVVQLNFINYVIVALLCEVNSVFLHIRQLMKMVGVDPNTLSYRINSLINILTYIFFRICSLTWMCRWLVLHKGAIHPVFHTIGVIGMAIMTVVNVVLFARLLNRDYYLLRLTKLYSKKNK